jgi:DNA-binding CsgD family transcriptional regulator/5-methylcytosine-specific restriction endonuclease McrA
MFVRDIGRRIIEMHSQGVPNSHIAHRLNVAQSTVHYHLRKLANPPTVSDAKPRRPRLPPGLTAQLVAQLLARGMSRVEIARRLGLAKSTVTYHARQLGEKIDGRFANRIDWHLVKAYYDAGHSVRECMETFRFSYDSWHDAILRGAVTPRPAFKPLDEIFAANTRRGRGHLKQRLLSAGLKDGSCERCGISDWLGLPLSVALHHINGDRLDNRVENLELLCPNCHSQTDTYSGRNGRRQRLAS